MTDDNESSAQHRWREQEARDHDEDLRALRERERAGTREERNAFQVFAPSASRAASLQAARQRGEQAAALAQELRAMRLAPQYEASSQALGSSDMPLLSPADVAQQRQRVLGKQPSNPAIRRHLESEERLRQRREELRRENERRLAAAREQAQRNAALEAARQRAIPTHDPLLAAEAAIGRKRAGDMQHAAARCSPDAQRLLHRLMINITREPAQERVRKLNPRNPRLALLFADEDAIGLLHAVGFRREYDPALEAQGILEETYVLPIPHDLAARADQLEQLRAVAATLAHRSGAQDEDAKADGEAQPAPRPSHVAPAETADPPEFLLCPILQEVMVDPVVTLAGQTYERRAIESWFQRCEQRRVRPCDPISREPLTSTALTPNVLVRSQARTYSQSRGANSLCGSSASGQASTSADLPPPPAAPSASSVPTVPSELSDAVRQMVDMGFSRDRVDFALENADGNVESALMLLLD